MKDNDDVRIPYVSKELCEYLRGTHSLPFMLNKIKRGSTATADYKLGYLDGLNDIIDYLEAIQIQQEENDGIHW